MKILQLVQKPQRRGAEMFAFQLTSHLLELGHEVNVVYLYPDPGDNALPLRNGDRIVGKDPSHFSEKIPGWNVNIVSRVSKMLKEFRPDVVQMNGARTVKYGAFLRFLNAKSSWALIYRNIGDPLVWQRGILKKQFYRRFIFSQIDGMVAVNSNSFQALKTIGPQKLITTIPRAVDPRYFSPSVSRKEIRRLLNTPDSAPVVIYVGSLTIEKRLDRLIEAFAFAKLKVPNLHLWIAGAGILHEELRKQADKTPHPESIQFLGSLKDVASHVNASDLLTITSDTEGIPGVVLEAALLEVPSISTNVGGVSECIVDQETGILVQSKSPGEIGTAIALLAQNEGLRFEMGKRAKQLVLEQFSMNKVADAYLRFYSQVLSARNGSQRERNAP